MPYSYYPLVPHLTTPLSTCRPLSIANRATQDRIIARRAIRSSIEHVAISQPCRRYCIDELDYAYSKPILFDRGPKPIILGSHGPKPLMLGSAW